MADHPLRPATHRTLGEPLPHQLGINNGTQAALLAHCCFHPEGLYAVLALVSQGYSPPEGTLPTRYAPVRRWDCSPLDLHVLGPPLAFALSQDQTLQFVILVRPSWLNEGQTKLYLNFLSCYQFFKDRRGRFDSVAPWTFQGPSGAAAVIPGWPDRQGDATRFSLSRQNHDVCRAPTTMARPARGPGLSITGDLPATATRSAARDA